MEGSNPFVRLEVWLKVSYFLIYIPLLIGLFRFRRLSPLQVKVLVIVGLTFLNDTLTYVLRIQVEPNLWVYHVFVPVLIWAMYRVYVVSLTSLSTYLMRWIMGFVTAFSIFNTLFLQSTNIFNSNAIVVSGILFIVLSLVYFYELIERRRVDNYRVTPMMWFNIGVLLHYSGTLVLFFFVNSLREQSVDIMLTSWMLNMVFTGVLLGFYSAALWVRPQP